MGFYEEIRQDTVLPALQEFGAPMSVTIQTPGTIDEVLGSVGAATEISYPGQGLLINYSVKEIDGQVVQRGDKKVLFMFDDPTVTVLEGTNMPITAFLGESTDLYTIQNVDSLAPGGVAVMYTLQVRK